jgi:hypothetical protein
MKPCTSRGKPLCWLLLLLLAALGCGDVSAVIDNDSSDLKHEAGREFDPASSATIHGQVRWAGEMPVAPPFELLPNPLADPILQKKQQRSNPNAPLIEQRTKGIGNAVVFLRGIEPKRGRPWDHPPVRVELRNGEFHILQGEANSHYGFVRRGDEIEMFSRDPFFHALHADGAAFFSLTFPDPDRPLRRPLKDTGTVELASAAGYFWMRSYLFVDDHPYYTRTDSAGRFVLRQVPAGHCEIVCWIPNWLKARHERDPETGFITRIFFEPPLCRAQALTLKPGETRETTFALSPREPGSSATGAGSSSR